MATACPLTDADHPFFRDNPAGMAHVDGQGRMTAANAALGRLLARSDAESLIGAELVALAPVGHGPQLQDRLQQAWAGTTVHCTLPGPGGGELALSLSPLPDRDGLLLMATFTDITEPYRSEHTLSQLADILEASPDMVGMADPQGRPFYYNRAGLALFGVDSVTELTSQHIADLKPAWAWRQTRDEMLPTADRDGIWQGESALINRQGREVPISQIVLAMRDEAGEISHYVTIVHDLSEQKAREARLRHLTEVLEATPDLVSFSALDRTLLYVNRGGRRLLGLPDSPTGVGDVLPEAIQQEAVAGQWGHPAWAAEVIEAVGIPTAINQGVWEGETALVDVTGREIPTSQVILAHHDEQGEVERLSTIIRDISQYKAMQQALEREWNLFIGGPTVVFVWQNQPGWPVVYASPNVESVLSYAPEEIQGRPFGELIHPDDQERIQAEIQHHESQGTSSFDQEYRLLTGGGDYRWIEDFTVPVRNDEGQIEQFQGYLLDITERKSAERTRRQLTEILEVTPDLVGLFDPQGRLLYRNREAWQDWGLAADHIRPGQLIDLAFAPWARDLLRETALPVATEAGLWQGQTALLGEDGTEHPVSQVVLGHFDNAASLQRFSTILRPIGKTDSEASATGESHYHRIAASAQHGAQQLEEEGGPPVFSKIPVGRGDDLRFVALAEIRFFQAEGNYALAFTHDSHQLANLALADLERRLAQSGFLRCHRSYLISLQWVIGLKTLDGQSYLIMDTADEDRIPISRRNLEPVRAALGLV